MEGHSNIQPITSTAKAETTTALPRYQTDQSCTSIVQTVFHIILSFIRFIAQLAVVPLLMIQILDTYAYLCFTANSYRNMRAQYKLHLDQTAMIFAFYCSLMISLLSTTMVRWFPLPEKREVKPSECEDDSMMHYNYSFQRHQNAANHLQPSIKEMGLVYPGPSNQIEYLDPSNQIELAYLDPSS